MVIEREWAETFAREWIEAWNSHDLEWIFSHYAGRFEIISFLIVGRMNEPSGTLKGKTAVQPYLKGWPGPRRSASSCWTCW